jgi:hypothetical protein
MTKPIREHSHPFVGRERHLRALHDALGQVRTGKPILAGIGKSALVRQFLEQVRATDSKTVILSGRCYERESVPYKALDSLLDGLARYLKDLPTHEGDALLPREIGSLGQLFPLMREFQHRLPSRSPDPQDAHELRRRAVTVGRWWCSSMTSTGETWTVPPCSRTCSGRPMRRCSC